MCNCHANSIYFIQNKRKKKKMTPEQKAFFEYGKAVKTLETKIERIRNNARIRFKREYHELPIQFRGELWDDFRLYNVIRDVRRKRAACRLWAVPLIHRDCHNCAYKNIKPVPVVCSPCLNEGFAINWQPKV